MKPLNRHQAFTVGTAMGLISLIFLGVMLSHPYPWRESTVIAWIVYIVLMAVGFLALFQK
jgi:uncharacterized membrane protein